MDERPRIQGQLAGFEDNPGLEELNLVEFPLVLLAKSSPGQKTMVSQDVIFDKSQGAHVNRKCTVTGSYKWGLPNYYDMDVLLALMKLTNEQHRFRERTVNFSLYGLRKQLKLADDGRVNQRLKDGLLRLLSCTVEYENSWRSNGRWTSVEAFHLLDNLRLTNTRDGFDPGVEQHFKWNDVVVESIQASNSKGLDFDFYISLKIPTAKRLYRFLDKRWYHRKSWPFEVEPFCVNKLGMKSGQPTWRYRDKLKPGIAELVGRGWIADLGSETFTKEGKISIVNFRQVRKFRKAKQVVVDKADAPGGLEKELLDRGVKNAAELVAGHSSEKIREQIENFDDRNKHGEEKSPGWLRRSIEDETGFGFRKAFKSTAQREAEATRKHERIRKEAVEKARELKQREEDHQKAQEATRKFLELRNSCSEERQIHLEDGALEHVTTFHRTHFLKERRAGKVGLFHEMLWQQLIVAKLEASPKV